MKTDHKEILMSRNRTKRQHKVYVYEAMKNMLDGFAGHSVSENLFAISAAFLQQTGKCVDFLNEHDHLLIKEIRRAMTTCKALYAISQLFILIVFGPRQSCLSWATKPKKKKIKNN
jgi:protein-arginine kinase